MENGAGGLWDWCQEDPHTSSSLATSFLEAVKPAAGQVAAASHPCWPAAGTIPPQSFACAVPRASKQSTSVFRINGSSTCFKFYMIVHYKLCIIYAWWH